MRLARAKELLAGGTATIRETAACGFCNAGHFVNVFRQSIGVTPGRWRETQAVT